MTSQAPNPPRWADALLQSLLRPDHRESTSGDLLEEYRAAKHPSLGSARAGIWYTRQMLGILWHLIRPCAFVAIGANALRVLLGVSGDQFVGVASPATVLGLFARALWFGSVVQAPGLSLVDALICLWAGHRGFRRARLIRTGMLAAGSTSIIGFTILFVGIALSAPALLLAPFSKPFIFVILATLSSIALAYGVLMGLIGAVFAKWTTPPDQMEAHCHEPA